MPEIVTGQLAETFSAHEENDDFTWIAAILNDRRQLQDICFARDEQTARERCLDAHAARIEREVAELRQTPGWVPGSGGQQ